MPKKKQSTKEQPTKEQLQEQICGFLEKFQKVVPPLPPDQQVIAKEMVNQFRRDLGSERKLRAWLRSPPKEGEEDDESFLAITEDERRYFKRKIKEMKEWRSRRLKNRLNSQKRGRHPV